MKKLLFMFMVAIAATVSVGAQSVPAKRDSVIKVSIVAKPILNQSANQLVISSIETNAITNETEVWFRLDFVSVANASGYAPRKSLFRDRVFFTAADLPNGVSVAAVKAKLADLYGLSFN